MFPWVPQCRHLALYFALLRSLVCFTSSAPSFLFLFFCFVCLAPFTVLLLSALFSCSFSRASLPLYCSSFFCFPSCVPLFLPRSTYLDPSHLLVLIAFSSFLPFCSPFSLPTSFLLLLIFLSLKFSSHSSHHPQLRSSSSTSASVWKSSTSPARAQFGVALSTTSATPVAKLLQWRKQSYLFERVVTWHAAAPAGTPSSPVVIATGEVSSPMKIGLRRELPDSSYLVLSRRWKRSLTLFAPFTRHSAARFRPRHH